MLAHKTPLSSGIKSGREAVTGRHGYLLGDRAPEMACLYSDRQTKEDAEEKGETTQISAMSRH
jgi:hypothetical protein